jgi:hypothetical protein
MNRKADVLGVEEFTTRLTTKPDQNGRLWGLVWRNDARRVLLEAPGVAGESGTPWLPGKCSSRRLSCQFGLLQQTVAVLLVAPS